MPFKKPREIQWLVVGLGNPGEKFQKTRHNTGWMALDEIAEKANIPVQRLKYQALTGTCNFGQSSVMLMKPITYMNQSGQSVKQAAEYYKVPPERVLIISDDINLPLGKIRIRVKGRDGGHNGLKNIAEHLGTNLFPRIRIGVGDRPDPDMDLVDWVLEEFSLEEKAIIEETVHQAAEAAVIFIEQGPAQAMEKFN